MEQLRGLGCHIEHVVYETGPTGFSLCRALREAGFNASVVAASRIPRGAAAAAKSDRIDATKLATYLAGGLLRSVAVPTVEEEGYRALVRRRKRVGEDRARVKQKIKSLLLATGIAEPASLKRWVKTAAADLAALDLDPGHDRALASLIREYRFLQDEHRRLRREVARATKRLHRERYARLTRVSGVGEVVATTFLAEIFAPERFDRAEELTSYVGLAPVVRRSGDGPARARLRPVGQKAFAGDPGGRRLAMDLARPGGQGALQPSSRQVRSAAEGDLRCGAETGDQALAPCGGITASVNGGCRGRPPVGIADGSKMAGTLLTLRVPKAVLGDLLGQARMREGLRGFRRGLCIQG